MIKERVFIRMSSILKRNLALETLLTPFLSALSFSQSTHIHLSAAILDSSYIDLNVAQSLLIPVLSAHTYTHLILITVIQS